jgi:hypothetical protein
MKKSTVFALLILAIPITIGVVQHYRMKKKVKEIIASNQQ